MPDLSVRLFAMCLLNLCSEPSFRLTPECLEVLEGGCGFAAGLDTLGPPRVKVAHLDAQNCHGRRARFLPFWPRSATPVTLNRK
jgi:hypothetical protein